MVARRSAAHLMLGTNVAGAQYAAPVIGPPSEAQRAPRSDSRALRDVTSSAANQLGGGAPDPKQLPAADRTLRW